MKVGEYIRTVGGLIGKVIEIEGNAKTYEIPNRQENDVIEIIKSSPNIIDLIEIGDYVNGKKVIDKWEEPDWYGYFIKLDGEETVPTIRKIESIVTKEQFEEMKYEIK